MLLGAARDIRVVGEAENGHRAVEETKKLRPQVILLDVAMPLLNGLEAARQIAIAVPSARVLILSSYSDEYFVQQAIEAGAAGYVTKEAAGSDLCQAIREVHNGYAFFSPLILRRLLKLWHGREFRLGTAPPPRLTSRQIEVLQLIAEGYTSKQIAGLLSLTTKTVEKHRQALIDKVDCHNIASLTRLTRYAITNGVVELNIPPTTPAISYSWNVRQSMQRTP